MQLIDACGWVYMSVYVCVCVCVWVTLINSFKETQNTRALHYFNLENDFINEFNLKFFKNVWSYTTEFSLSLEDNKMESYNYVEAMKRRKYFWRHLIATHLATIFW